MSFIKKFFKKGDKRSSTPNPVNHIKNLSNTQPKASSAPSTPAHNPTFKSTSQNPVSLTPPEGFVTPQTPEKRVVMKDEIIEEDIDEEGEGEGGMDMFAGMSIVEDEGEGEEGDEENEEIHVSKPIVNKALSQFSLEGMEIVPPEKRKNRKAFEKVEGSKEEVVEGDRDLEVYEKDVEKEEKKEDEEEDKKGKNENYETESNQSFTEMASEEQKKPAWGEDDDSDNEDEINLSYVDSSNNLQRELKEERYQYESPSEEKESPKNKKDVSDEKMKKSPKKERKSTSRKKPKKKLPMPKKRVEENKKKRMTQSFAAPKKKSPPSKHKSYPNSLRKASSGEGFVRKARSAVSDVPGKRITGPNKSNDDIMKYFNHVVVEYKLPDVNVVKRWGELFSKVQVSLKKVRDDTQEFEVDAVQKRSRFKRLTIKVNDIFEEITKNEKELLECSDHEMYERASEVQTKIDRKRSDLKKIRTKLKSLESALQQEEQRKTQLITRILMENENSRNDIEKYCKEQEDELGMMSKFEKGEMAAKLKHFNEEKTRVEGLESDILDLQKANMDLRKKTREKINREGNNIQEVLDEKKEMKKNLEEEIEELRKTLKEKEIALRNCSKSIRSNSMRLKKIQKKYQKDYKKIEKNERDLQARKRIFEKQRESFEREERRANSFKSQFQGEEEKMRENLEEAQEFLGRMNKVFECYQRQDKSIKEVYEKRGEFEGKHSSTLKDLRGLEEEVSRIERFELIEVEKQLEDICNENNNLTDAITKATEKKIPELNKKKKKVVRSRNFKEAAKIVKEIKKWEKSVENMKEKSDKLYETQEELEQKSEDLKKSLKEKKEKLVSSRTEYNKEFFKEVVYERMLLESFVKKAYRKQTLESLEKEFTLILDIELNVLKNIEKELMVDLQEIYTTGKIKEIRESVSQKIPVEESEETEDEEEIDDFETEDDNKSFEVNKDNDDEENHEPEQKEEKDDLPGDKESLFKLLDGLKKEVKELETSLEEAIEEENYELCDELNEDIKKVNKKMETIKHELGSLGVSDVELMKYDVGTIENESDEDDGDSNYSGVVESAALNEKEIEKTLEEEDDDVLDTESFMTQMKNIEENEGSNSDEE